MKHITNILWDTDGEIVPELPLEVLAPDEVDDESIADWLSDKYGFCVDAFNSKELNGELKVELTIYVPGSDEEDAKVLLDEALDNLENLLISSNVWDTEWSDEI